ARNGFVGIKAIGSVGIEHEVEAQFDDQQGMLEQEAAQLAGVDEAFILADEKGFEVGAFGMGRAAWARALSLEVLNEGPVEEGKEGPILGDDGIMVKHGGHRGLVKDRGSGYHHKQLLLWVNWVFYYSAKGVWLRSRIQDESHG